MTFRDPHTPTLTPRRQRGYRPEELAPAHSTARRNERPESTAEPHPSQAMPATPLLYTPAQAAQLLAVKESWLRRKAGRRVIPCTFLGKHLRFSARDLVAIIEGNLQPLCSRPARRRR